MSCRPCIRIALALGMLAAAADAQDILQVFDGAGPHQNLGFSVAGVGDVDADGTPDFAITGWESGGVTGTGVISGADFTLIELLADALIVAGSGDLDADGTPDIALGRGNPQVSTWSGDDFGPLWSDGFVVQDFGASVAGGFDSNDDGHDDLIVGSGADGFFDAGGDTLRVYSGLDGSVLHEIDQYNPFNFPGGMGWSVSGFHDVDGDGRDEHLSGVPFSSGVTGPSDDHLTHTGFVRLYDGATGATVQTWAGDEDGDALGWSVATADVDGDGTGDVVAGTGGNFNPLNGRPMYVRAWSGSDFGELWCFSGVGTGPMVVAGMGDLDGDGGSEVLVGSTRDERAWMLSGATGAVLFELSGSELSWFGAAVAGVGDVDADGRGDFVVAAPIADTGGGSSAGRVVLYSGRPPAFTSLHGGLAGQSGLAPMLRGNGVLEPGTSGSLRLSGAEAFQPVLLFFDLAVADLPFLGGTLVPGATFTPLNFSTGADGKLALPWSSWPAGVPAYTQIYVQAWVGDSGGPAGAAATRALRMWTP